MFVPDANRSPAPQSSPEHSEPLGQTARRSAISELLTQLNVVAIRLNHRGRTNSSGSAKLAVAEQSVLEIINRAGALTVPQIAKARSTSRQNIQILVDRLERQGQIETAGNPAHKRSVLVRLTEKGKNWLAVGEKGQRRLLSEIESQLSEIEISATVATLRKVHGLLTREEPDQPGAPEAQFAGPATNRQIQPARSNQVKPEMDVEEFPVNLL